MVIGRLSARVRQLSLPGFRAYRELLNRPAEIDERQNFIDLMTTNETYFFREPAHFNLLGKEILEAQPSLPRPFRIWSAASSSGEEAYSMAMTLHDHLGDRTGLWEVTGTDICRRVLERARRGHYRMERLDSMPRQYLFQYCLKGFGSQEGNMLVDRRLRDRVRFLHLNLAAPFQDIGPFDVIFLRNVLIYFQQDMKRAIVDRVVRQLRPGGWLVIGHSESLRGMDERLNQYSPSVYRLP